MCGLTGWFSQQPTSDADEDRISRMTASLRHRGPDGEQVKRFAHAALGHTRLAIIDREGGEQPFVSDDGRYCLVYNGEIYNHEALRQDLENAGYRFRTRSDTEVVLATLICRGWQGLNNLRGMFALAFWDEQEQRALLARDPLGIKPLFIQQSARSIAFGSEAKAILQGGYHPELDPAQLHLLMNFRYLPGTGSLFKGIRQLGAGEVMEWTLTDGQQGSSHQITVPESPDTLSIIDTLKDSVQSHLVSDVPIGVYLSGGIDSACVAALSEQKLKGFTLEVGDDPKEADNAADSARILGLPHHREAIGFDPATDLTRLLWHLEVPKINALQGNLLARVAAAEVKVVLSGLGGDELFMGYNAHRLFVRFMGAPRWASPISRLGAGLIKALSSTPWSEGERALRMAASSDAATTYGLLRNLWDSAHKRKLSYGERLLDQPLPDAFETLRSLWPEADTPLESMRRFEWRQKMTNDLLWNEDRVSMAESLEVRVPLVDGPLSRRLEQMSGKELMRGTQQKAVFRENLNTVLPNEILNRPKSGFQVDSPQFFHNHLLPLARLWLSEERVRHYRLFNPTYVKQLQGLAIHKRHRWHYFQLYLMLLSHLWVALFEEKQWKPI